jgi:hypothetical protein
MVPRLGTFHPRNHFPRDRVEERPSLSDFDFPELEVEII